MAGSPPSEPSARCRRPRSRNRGPCRNPVKQPGAACHHHPGLLPLLDDADLPAARLLPRPTQRRVAEPRAFVPDGPLDTAASQAHSILFTARARIEGAAFRHVGEHFHRAVSQPVARCVPIAKTARAMLDGAKSMRRLMTGGDLSRVEVDLVATLVDRIPLPAADELVMVGRTLQLTGILLCWVNRVPLEGCPCFADMTRAEGMVTVKGVLARGGDDWQAMAELASG